MKKDFEKWHDEKNKLHEKESRVYFHEREVWWCSIGANVGFEEDGKGKRFSRPVVIVRKFNKEVSLAIPLTTKMRTGRYYFPMKLHDTIPRMAVLSQIRLIDAKRLSDKFGVVTEENFFEMKKALIRIIQ